VLSGSRDGTDGGMIRQRLLLGAAASSRQFEAVQDIDGCFGRGVVALGDVTDDGRDDWGVLCGFEGGSRFGVIAGGAQLPLALSDGFDTTGALLTLSRGIDLDGDGVQEVLLTRQGAGSFVWRRGNFDPAAPTIANQVLGGDSLGSADHNGDGRLDLLIWASGGNLSWAGGGASLNFTPIALLPFSAEEASTGIAF
jgi:hypothetical protein